jgi:hypothetical protein
MRSERQRPVVDEPQQSAYLLTFTIQRSQLNQYLGGSLTYGESC